MVVYHSALLGRKIYRENSVPGLIYWSGTVWCQDSPGQGVSGICSRLPGRICPGREKKKGEGRGEEEGREVSIFQLRADSEGQEMTTRGVI